MRYLLFVSLICSATIRLVAQDRDSLARLESQILSRPETDLTVVSKTRDALREAVLADDTSRVALLVSFLRTRFDPDRVEALWPREEVLVAYWAGSYDRVLDVVRRWDEEGPVAGRLTPPQDLLERDLTAHSRARVAQLEARLRANGFDPEKEDVLRLFLHYTIGPDEGERATGAFRRRINAEADDVLTMHKGSEFEPFIRRVIRYVVRPSPWGYGVELGFGPSRLGGALADRFLDPFLFEFSVEGAHGSLYGLVQLSIGGGSKVRATFTHEGDWGQGMEVQPASILAACGVLTRAAPWLVVTPHAGFGYVDWSPPEEVRSIPGFDVSLGFATFVAGVNFDIPIADTWGMTGQEGGEQGYWYVRLRAGWQRPITSVALARGSMWALTLSVGGFARPLERDL